LSSSDTKSPAIQATKPQRTKKHLEAIGKQKKRWESSPARPKLKLGNLGSLLPDSIYDRAILAESIGTSDIVFLKQILVQLQDAISATPVANVPGTNFLLSVIQDIEPRDQIEAMHAAQLAVIHVAAMSYARRLCRTDYIPDADGVVNILTKLNRTFALQMQALKSYRTRGEQKITVHHVSVNEGGQAIVGNVTQEVSAKNKPDDSKSARAPNNKNAELRRRQDENGTDVTMTGVPDDRD
jgi:hypothetical protein